MTAADLRLVARVSHRGVTGYARPIDDVTLEGLSGDPIGGLKPNGARFPTDQVDFLPPVPATKLVGIGKNYPEAADGKPRMSADFPTPSFFLMGPNAMAGHGSTVTLPAVFGSVLVEGELAVVMGRRAKDLTPRDAQGAILGYTIVNDFSGRDTPLDPVPAAVKKSADGFAPIGPYLNLDSRLRNFQIQTRIEGKLLQSGNTADMLCSIVECLCYVSSIMTLECYDVVSTGTPTPKPKLLPGQEVSVTVTELGTLTNRLQAHEA